MSGPTPLLSKKPIVISTADPAQVQAFKDLLGVLTGTPLASTGDISVNINGQDYVISGQSGGFHAAAVKR